MEIRHVRIIMVANKQKRDLIRPAQYLAALKNVEWWLQYLCKILKTSQYTLSLGLEERFDELASKLGLAIFFIVNLDWGHMDDIWRR